MLKLLVMEQDIRWSKLFINSFVHLSIFSQFVSIKVEPVLYQSLDIFRLCLAWVVSISRKIREWSVQ